MRHGGAQHDGRGRCTHHGTDRGRIGVEVLCRTREVVPEEPRDADPRAVLGLIDDAHGAWRCHAAFECSTVCPAGVDPGAAIMRLRGRLLRDRLPRLVGRYHREVRS